MAGGGNASTGVGGGGGSLQLTSASLGTSAISTGGIYVGASMDVSAGSGMRGGVGGNISLRQNPSAFASGGSIAVYGVPTVALRGGAGTTSGGNAGQDGSGRALSITNAISETLGAPAPGGSVVNYANVDASGGDASAGVGGVGGQVYLSTQTQLYFAGPSYEFVINGGAITTSGGKGSTGGGSAGEVYMAGRSGITNSGAITSNGGLATANGVGGNGSVIVFATADGPLSNSGDLSVNAGNSTGAGQHGAAAEAISITAGIAISNSGTLSAAGGNADPGSEQGGQGGQITLNSISGITSNTVTAPAGISVIGGTGQSAGTPGSVTIDGANVTSAWTF